MSFEMTMLVWSVILTLIQMFIAALGAALALGLPAAIGNRERLPPLAGWAGRAQRAHRNMLESLVLFAVLVTVTEINNRNNWLTGLGAELFVGGRVAYAIVYIAGVTWVRTAVWAVSVVGLLVILLQLPLV